MYKFFIAASSLTVLAATATAAEFHIAPTGSDRNPGTADKPFATLEKARDTVRASKAAHPTEGNSIILHGGTYTLTKPLLLTAQDSGTPAAPLRIIAAKGESPIITSERTISAWKLTDSATPNLAKEAQGKVWVAAIPKGWRFHYLYADGQALQMARMNKNDNWHHWPKPVGVGSFSPEGQPMTFPAGLLDGLPDNGDVEMNLLPTQYWNTLSVLRNINPATKTANRHSKAPTAFAKNHFSGHGNYNLQNALKFLTEPGEWCVDSAAGKVYYWPAAGTPERQKIHAPGLYRLLEAKGSDAARVHDIELRGLTFTYTDRLPEDQWPDEWTKRQAELPDAMVFLEGVENWVIEENTFSRSGSYGVALEKYAQRIRFVRNEVAYPGCGGIQLQGYGPGTTDVNKGNVIRRNYIHHTGNGGYLHSAAVSLYQSGGNDIALNWIDHAPYTAIVIVGAAANEFGTGTLPFGPWDTYGNCDAMHHTRWNEIPGGKTAKFSRADFRRFLHSNNNQVRDNIATHYMEKLGDGGALYSWSCGIDNLWEGNLLRRDKTRPGESLCIALYMDDYVDGATLRNNLCWHIGRPTINKGANKWENNIIEATKPAGYDQRLCEIAAAAAKDGGWLRVPPDAELADLMISGNDTFYKETKVSIITGLNGVIHYTLDGSAPTANSPVYTTPVTINKTTIVKAFVADAAGKPLAATVIKTLTKLEPKPMAGGKWIPAASATEMLGPRLDDKKSYIGWLSNGGAFAFGPYEFKPGQLQAVELEIGAVQSGNKIHVRLDGPDGKGIGTLVTQATGDYEKFAPQSVDLWAYPGPYNKPGADASGAHTLWFVADGGQSIGSVKAIRMLDAAGAIAIPTRAAPADPHYPWAEPRYQALCKNAAKSDAAVIFVGDSITQGWETTGAAVWAKAIAPLKTLNLGIGGDRIEHMSWRLENGNLPDTLNPKVAVIMAGTNNSDIPGLTPEAIAAGSQALIARIQKRKPDCKVLLLGIFPRRDPHNVILQQTNPLLAKLADGKNVFFLDPGAKFLASNGSPDAKYYSDPVHINTAGYQLWADAMLPGLTKLLAP